MSYDTNNVFAKILRHEIPNKTIYEDDFVLAFYDIAPKAKIHALVIPKGAFVDFQDLITHGSPKVIDGFFHGILATVSALNLNENGYRLVFNTGKDSGQEVPHLHAHILAGEKLSMWKMQEIIKKWRTTKMPYTCPHGRPISKIIPHKELASWFQRNG